MAGSIGLNVIAAFVSIIALIQVCRRRFEMFSSVSLLLFSTGSLLISALQIACVLSMQENAITEKDEIMNSTRNKIGG